MLLAAAAAAIAATSSPASAPAIGARREFHGALCYRVTQLDTGPGGAPYAWLLAEQMPRGVIHVRASDVAAAPACRDD